MLGERLSVVNYFESRLDRDVAGRANQTVANATVLCNLFKRRDEATLKDGYLDCLRNEPLVQWLKRKVTGSEMPLTCPRISFVNCFSGSAHT